MTQSARLGHRFGALGLTPLIGGRLASAHARDRPDIRAPRRRGLAVDAEVDINRGLPSFSLVGLPDAAVRESRERVRAAIANSGFDFPQQRITANLAPADLRKAGPGFDLAIAAAVLVASGQLPQAPARISGRWPASWRWTVRSGPCPARSRWPSGPTGAASAASPCPPPTLAEAALVDGI